MEDVMDVVLHRLQIRGDQAHAWGGTGIRMESWTVDFTPSNPHLIQVYI